jgi:hypothetical protein
MSHAASSSATSSSSPGPAAKRARTLHHSCPTCGISQDRKAECKGCKARRERRWCLGCGVVTTGRRGKVGGGWSCGKKACVDKLQSTGEVYKTLAREGVISGEVPTSVLDGLQEAREVLRKKVKRLGPHPTHCLATPPPPHSDLLYATGVRNRLAVRPEPNTAHLTTPDHPTPAFNLKWGQIFDSLCHASWRKALVDLLGPCRVRQVFAPVVWPPARGTNPTPVQPLHQDHFAGKWKTTFLVVNLNPEEMGPETRVVLRSHGGRYEASTNLTKDKVVPYPWAEESALFPEGRVVLLDGATLHSGPGRAQGRGPRDSVLIFAIEADGTSEAEKALIRAGSGRTNMDYQVTFDPDEAADEPTIPAHPLKIF